MRSTSACTSLATATVLPSGCRLTLNSTAGFPFAVTMVYTGFTPAETAATSATFTGTPACVYLMTTCPSWSGSCSCASTNPRYNWWFCSSRPGESMRLVRLTASRMSVTVTPAARSFAGSGVMWNSGSCPPWTRTVATPSRRFRRGFNSYVASVQSWVCGTVSEVRL